MIYYEKTGQSSFEGFILMKLFLFDFLGAREASAGNLILKLTF